MEKDVPEEELDSETLKEEWTPEKWNLLEVEIRLVKYGLLLEEAGLTQVEIKRLLDPLRSFYGLPERENS